MTSKLDHIPAFPVNGSTHEIGAWGESLACKHLEARGFLILDRNWRTRYGELDVVAWSESDATLIAIEVKTRREGGQVPAVLAISRQKVSRLRSMLGQWLAVHEVCSSALRVDLVAVTVNDAAGWYLEHIEAIA